MEIRVGDVVKLTGKFLRNTGQMRGGEGSKRWTVVACACGLCVKGDFVAVDEPSPFAAQPGNEDMPPMRHIAKANLTVPARRCDTSADGRGVWVKGRGLGA